MPLASPADPSQTGSIQPDETSFITAQKALPVFRVALFAGLSPSKQSLTVQVHRLKLYQSDVTAKSTLMQWLEDTASDLSKTNPLDDNDQTGLLPPHLRLYPLPYPSPDPDG